MLNIHIFEDMYTKTIEKISITARYVVCTVQVKHEKKTKLLEINDRLFLN